MILSELPEKIPIGQANDLTGKRFEKLVVLYRCQKPKEAKSRGAYWCCECDCGAYTIIRADSLRSRAIISCGCEGKKRRADSVKRDLTNQRFGSLVAKYPIDKVYKPTGCILWHCKCDCGREVDIPTSALTTGNSTTCGFHTQSKGASKIENILIKNKIKYVKEKTFPDCVDKGKLRFDFYLPDYNYCIEYDGEQHFNKANSGFFKDRLEDIQRRDAIKNQYCKNNNIKLIRISYLDIKNISTKEDLFEEKYEQ